MSFGMRIWGPTGKLELDENSFTVRIIYSGVVAFITGGNRYINISIPGVSPSTHSAICIPIGAYPKTPMPRITTQFSMNLRFIRAACRFGLVIGLVQLMQ